MQRQFSQNMAHERLVQARAATLPAALQSVNPASAADADLERRFGGLRRLYGSAGAARIARARVCVVGVGGVGAWAAEALARSGVGAIQLIDMDHVAESNINRQVHALDATLGQAKVQAMAERIAQISPYCHVDAVDDFVTPDNWPGVLGAALPEAIIDACDQLPAKLVMAAWALRPQCKARFIAVGAAGGKCQPELVRVGDLADATHDPLLAKLRYQLRRQQGAARAGKRIGLTSVSSAEAVRRPDASCSVTASTAGAATGAMDGSLNCHGYGSAVAVTATFGLCAAGWVLNRLAESAESTL
ncbi:MAG: tRNA threonylcarbamoyladenosine dehydratase [Burkholderiaceae bacterium]|jgi:tRNA A37 threonylcarbamoyladenosine dehydratase|nr:tRNA threonylcarbamoyladenosine dehydratase [Burkholderiaceae bacterium]